VPGSGSIIAQARPDSEPGPLLDLWEYLVDPKVGIVGEVSELSPDDDEPAFFHYASRACDAGRFGGVPNSRRCGGASTVRYRAIAKAVGEAVERYCSAVFDREGMLCASFEELRQQATPPEDFILYTTEQYAAQGFPWKPFTRDTRVCWVRGRSLEHDDDTLVPAAMVHVPFPQEGSRPDSPVAQSISTGSACGTSYESAALGGLCEAVERDAFALTWQARMGHPRIAAATAPPSVQNMVARFQAVGLRVEIVDITCDIRIPTILTLALGEAATSPALAVATATHPSAEVAALKSLEELAHTRRFARQLHRRLPPLPVDLAGQHPLVRDQRDHLRFYCPQESVRYAEFLWGSVDLRPFPAVVGAEQLPDREGLAAAREAVVAAGLHPVACDVTTPDISLLGLSVVKVVVPGLQPLYLGHSNRALGGRRLYTVPQKLGFPGIGVGRDNPYPHPFP